MSSYGCNSCKNLDPNAKKPGRTSGYLFYCKAKGTYVNAAKESCDYYEEEQGRSSYEVNAIYKDSNEYSDLKPDYGCNGCGNLDDKAKKPGKNGGYLYFCKVKNAYINAATDSPCEKYSDGFRSSDEKNTIYDDCKNYSDSTASTGSLLFILVLVVIFIIIYLLFLR